jgi:hypothetical protein
MRGLDRRTRPAVVISPALSDKTLRRARHKLAVDAPPALESLLSWATYEGYVIARQPTGSTPGRGDVRSGLV